MSGDFGIVYPLWTDSGGPGKLLDRAVGEVGLDHLTIPVVTGRQEQFRLSPAQPPHCFVTEGGWHYPPDLACYKGGPVKPRSARWFGKRDLLSRVCEYAARRNVAVVFRIDLRAVTGLVEHEPHLRPRNAWGDEVIAAGPCPSNPEVRELLHGTLDDLLRYEPTGFQLVDWAPDLPTDRDAPRSLDWQPLARKLADVCFCPPCRQLATLAGSDPDQVARSIQVHVENLLAHPKEDGAAAKAHEDEVINAYVQIRRRDTAAWLHRLAEMHRDRRRYFLTDAATCESVGPLLAEETFLLVLRGFRPLRAADENTLQAAIRSLQKAYGLTLPTWRPDVEQAGELVRQVSTTTHAGLEFFDFEGLDEAPEEALTWLRQAVRFARRG
jgi:hypothetical protein